MRKLFNRVRRGAPVIFLAVWATGCANGFHFHSDDRQKAGETGNQALNSFTDSEKGLTPLTLKNLEARMALKGAVNDERILLDDERHPVNAMMITWNELRTNFYGDFGVINNADFEQGLNERLLAINQITKVLALLKASEDVLAIKKQQTVTALIDQIAPAPADAPAVSFKNIDDVVDFAMSVEKACRDASQALRQDDVYRKQRTATLDALFQEVEASRDPQVAWALVPLLQSGLDQGSIDLLNRYLQLLTKQWEQLKVPEVDSNRKATPSAPASDDKEVDPAEYLRKSGKDVKTTVDNYVQLLTPANLADPTSNRDAARVSGTMKFLAANYTGAGTAPRRPYHPHYWQNQQYVPYTTKHLPLDFDKDLHADSAFGTGNFFKLNVNEPTGGINSTLMVVTSPQFKGGRRRSELTLYSSRLLTLQKTLKAAVDVVPTEEECPKVDPEKKSTVPIEEKAKSSATVNQAIARGTQQRNTAVSGLDSTIANAAVCALKKNGKITAEDEIILRKAIAAIADPKGPENFLDRLKNISLSDDDKQKLAHEFLDSVVLKLDPAISSQLQLDKLGPLQQKGLADMGSRLLKMLGGPEQEKIELVRYLSQLYSVEIDILKENSRHYDALSSVNALELARWTTVQKLGYDVVDIYPDEGNALFDLGTVQKALDAREHAVNPSNHWKTPNFGAGQFGEFTAFKPAAQPAAQAATQPTTEPAAPNIKMQSLISPSDLVLPSIRAMAIQAAMIRDAAKEKFSSADQATYYAAIHRVALANRLLGGYLLTDSVNERYAADNSLRLETELRQHDLLLNGIEAEIHEDAIRHTLNELNAYHSGGVTNADINALFQDVALTVIGVGANK